MYWQDCQTVGPVGQQDSIIALLGWRHCEGSAVSYAADLVVLQLCEQSPIGWFCFIRPTEGLAARVKRDAVNAMDRKLMYSPFFIIVEMQS